MEAWAPQFSFPPTLQVLAGKNPERDATPFVLKQVTGGIGQFLNRFFHHPISRTESLGVIRQQSSRSHHI